MSTTGRPNPWHELGSSHRKHATEEHTSDDGTHLVEITEAGGNRHPLEAPALGYADSDAAPNLRQRRRKAYTMNFLPYSSPFGQSRRRFLQAAALSPLTLSPGAEAADGGPNVLGPMPGYSPLIGTLVSEMTWMRSAVLRSVKGMTQDGLDFLLDPKANRAGALLLHLAATEKLYQLNTLDQVSLKDIETSPAFKDWIVPMDLGEPARVAIKGHDLGYYLDILREVREKSLAEFRKRDDKWLLAVDQTWPWGPTNNLCKLFHVCEHESHHAGQISLIRGRGPGAKPDNG